MLEALGNLGDFVGGVAIIVTLLYLAAQVRQNTTSVRAASRLEIASGWRAHNRLTLDPEARRAYAKGLHEFPEMSFDERGLFSTLLADHAVFFQGVFALYEEGQIDDATYEDYLTWFACQVATPGGAAFWAENSRFLVRGAAAAVDARLAGSPLPDIRELAQYRLQQR